MPVSMFRSDITDLIIRTAGLSFMLILIPSFTADFFIEKQRTNLRFLLVGFLDDLTGYRLFYLILYLKCYELPKIRGTESNLYNFYASSELYLGGKK